MSRGLAIKRHAGEADAFEAARMRVLVVMQKLAARRSKRLEDGVGRRQAANPPAILFRRDDLKVPGRINRLGALQNRLILHAAMVQQRLANRFGVVKLRAEVGQVAADDVTDRLWSLRFGFSQGLDHADNIRLVAGLAAG